MNNYTFDEIKVGMKEMFTVRVTPESMDSFCRITGDVNPLHSAGGYEGERRVAFGMLTASYLSTLAGVYLPGMRSLIQHVEISFARPVFVDDTLTVSGEVAEKCEMFQFITVKVAIRNQKGEKVARGKMQVKVREETVHRITGIGGLG